MQHAEPDIPLTPPEKALLATIQFDWRALNTHEREIQNGNAVCGLMKSLLNRGAIPKRRVMYFIDPDCNPFGTRKSLKQNFERNGPIGDDILKHPHFLEYFRYFLYGPDLPSLVSRDFRDAMSRYREINASNISSLKRAARNIAGAYELNGSEVCNEFYKLALECGLKYWHAKDIWKAIRKMP